MKKRKVPHTFVIVFFIIVVAAVLTWIIPPGKYVQEQVGGETVMKFYYANQLPEAVGDNGFHPEPQTWQVFSAFYKGFVKQANIIVFILIIGGAFWIMNKSRAIDMGILSFLKFTKRLERSALMRKVGVNNIVIILVMLLFSLFGSVFGMSEEFSGAMLNPFTIGIAQGIADIPLFTGIGYRAVCWAILTVVGSVFVLLYARKVKKNPQSSIMYEDDAYWRKMAEVPEEEMERHTPRKAWFVFAFLTAVLITFSILYPQTTLKIDLAENGALFRSHVALRDGLFLGDWRVGLRVVHHGNRVAVFGFGHCQRVGR